MLAHPRHWTMFPTCTHANGGRDEAREHLQAVVRLRASLYATGSAVQMWGVDRHALNLTEAQHVLHVQAAASTMVEAESSGVRQLWCWRMEHARQYCTDVARAPLATRSTPIVGL